MHTLTLEHILQLVGHASQWDAPVKKYPSAHASHSLLPYPVQLVLQPAKQGTQDDPSCHSYIGQFVPLYIQSEPVRVALG